MAPPLSRLWVENLLLVIGITAQAGGEGFEDFLALGNADRPLAHRNFCGVAELLEQRLGVAQTQGVTS